MALSLARSSVTTSSLWFKASSLLANLFFFQLASSSRAYTFRRSFFVVLAVPLKLGPLGGELAGRRLGALLQLGAPVAEALVLGLKRPHSRRIATSVS